MQNSFKLKQLAVILGKRVFVLFLSNMESMKLHKKEIKYYLSR